MNAFEIRLASISDVKSFVSKASDRDYEIDLVSGRYIIDAKSIMGIFSLDLSKPIKVEVHASDSDIAAFREMVKEFVL